jgi:secretion/DNA translocation related CpaE-like protein
MSQPARPLVITDDPDLLDDMLRLCAVAGVEAEVAQDAGAGRRAWLRAPIVVVGHDVAEALIRAAPVRRADVIMVGTDPDDEEVWSRGLALGAEHVLFLPEAEEWLVKRLGDAEDGERREAVTVSVVGGRGGAGASTLAAALAFTGMRRGLRALLLDADLLGGEDTAGLRWPDLQGAQGRVNGTALRDALPTVDELSVLTWDRKDLLTVPPVAMRTVLDASRRSHDLVVADLPRRLDEAASEAVAASALTVLLVPAEIRAVAAASRVAAGLLPVAPHVRVAVRGPAPAGLSADVVASSLGLPLLGEMAAEPGIERALERGDPPAWRGRGPLARFCGAVLDEFVPQSGERVA